MSVKFSFNLSFLGVKYGDYGKINPIEYNERMALLTSQMKIKECVLSISSRFKGMSLFFARDFYPLKEQSDVWNNIFENKDSTVLIKDLYFPLPAIKAYKFMEHHYYLCQRLGVSPFTVANQELVPISLRKAEKKVLSHWIKYPRAKNLFLSEKTGVSRSTIGNIKKRLLRQKVVNIVHIPHWNKLGINLGVIMYLRVRPESEKTLKLLHSIPEIIFLLASSYEILLFSLFSDYNSYQCSPWIHLLRQEKILLAEPQEILLPLSETVLNIDAEPLMSTLFGEK